MRREIKQLKAIKRFSAFNVDYPSDTYKNNRSKRARSRDKKKEHKLARTLSRRLTAKLVADE